MTKHLLGLVLLALSTTGTCQAAVIASNDFDSPVNLLSSTSSAPGFNSFTSAGDGWGVYNFSTGGPFDLFDSTVMSPGGGAAFPTDQIGVVQSTKTDNFFGMVDVVNSDNGNAGMTATYVFNIADATTPDLNVSIDFAGMGDFESSDVLTITGSIDGAPAINLFTSSVDEAGSLDYIMEDGTTRTENDPFAINGVTLFNAFQTITAPIVGTGNELAITIESLNNAGGEAIALDNITISAVPEPSSLTALAVVGLVAVQRRRRR